jgi:raffinose/stachyose/melibiose transport system substrate-binding protein
VDASTPSTKDGSVVGATITAFRSLLKSNGLVDFMANATASINVNAIVPQTQLLVANQTTPADYSKALQTEYARELGE